MWWRRRANPRPSLVLRPRNVGFQTHTSPVLLGHGERAELATEEYTAVTNVLEDFVVLKVNPEYIERKK